VRPQHRADPVREVEVERDEQPHADAEYGEHRQPGGEHPGEDLAVADLVEPQPVGPHGDHAVEQREQ
jgi:hypothetical protein